MTWIGSRSGRANWTAPAIEAIIAVASLALAATAVFALTRANVRTPDAPPYFIMTQRLGIVLLCAAAIMAVGYALWFSRCEAQARRTARLRLYEGVAVVAIMYLIYFRVIAAIGAPDFYHEGEHLVPAVLMQKGEFPWRDFLFIHGIFMDGLKTNIGEWLFGGGTRWAGQMMSDFMFPLYLSAFYWFFRLAFSGNVLLALVATLMVGALHADMRAVLYPVCLVMLFLAIERGTWLWCALFGAITAFQIVITPEFAFFGAAGGITIVLRDSVEAWHTHDWRAFRRTLRTATATMAMTAVIAVYLASHQALIPFLDIATTIAGGHRYVGGIAKQHFNYVSFYSNYPLICGVGILLGALALVRNRLTIPPWYFATIALAIYIILYYPKYLGRADGHLFQVVALATPLLVMAGLAAVLTAEGVLASAFGGLQRWLPYRGAVMAGVAGVLVLIPLPPALPRSAAAELLLASNTVTARTIVGVPFSPVPRTGFIALDKNGLATVAEMAVFLDSHLDAGDTVFDMTNASALFHFHLDRKPASRYFHVSLAVREQSQIDVIRDLVASRPKLVVFDGHFGMPAWDGVHNSVRHYLVSYYLLAHYRPVAVVSNFLILARNDIAGGFPALDHTATEGFTASCFWGHHPYFTQFARVNRFFSVADMEIVQRSAKRYRVDLAGWAGVVDGNLRQRRLYVAVDGHVVVESVAKLPRPEVAQVMKAEHLAFSGFRFGFDLAEELTDAKVRVFTELEDGSVGEVLTGAQMRHGPAPPPAAIRFSDGRTIRVTPGIMAGALDSKTVGTSVSVRVAPVQKRIFALQFDIAGRNPKARFDLVDVDSQQHVATFAGALSNRATLTVPVGGCLGASSIAGKAFEVRIRIADPAPGIDIDPTISAVRAVELPLEALTAVR